MTNQRPVFMSRPIRGQHVGHVISLNQSEAFLVATEMPAQRVATSSANRMSKNALYKVKTC